jgi:hypothetical protein
LTRVFDQVFLYNPADPFINPDDITAVIAKCRGAPHSARVLTSI